ncbi:hypothetical protein [Bifidobacterium aquikefiri]|uniref:Glycosyltransferase RgtA/B/C/D-like domain-containing protein n=1 Tax=Bifidobacterium aquikefiri TaxID=1653207 RepID=A0A261G6S3_9BIFI|nr:hypothetical protein [Bifidobacterium aquikefiri]OZG67119.1 hypothetical protein BAQU_1191 [Bifidobacterium aquikefiri]
MSAKTPSFPFDEITLLQYAKYFSGTGMHLPLAGSGYFPGWAIIMAPLWWITSDPQTMYHLAIALGVVVGVVTVWPLTLLVERFSLDRAKSAAVAGIIMCMPSRTVQAGYAMSEKFLCLMIVCTALAAYRLAEGVSLRRAVQLSLLTSTLILTHARAIVVLPITIVWLVLLLRKQGRLALLSVSMTAGLGTLTFVGSILLNQHLLEFQFTQGYSIAGNVFSGASIILRTFLGQAWYQIVASLGIVVLGVVVLTQKVSRDWKSSKRVDAHLWMLAVGVGAFSFSVLAWANSAGLFTTSGRGRLDPAIYGRYSDPFTMLLIVAGLASIMKGLHELSFVWAAFINLIIIGATVLWVAPRALTWGIVTPAHVPGILSWGSSLPYPQSMSPGWLPSVYQHYDTWNWLMPTWTNLNRFWLHASAPTVAFLMMTALYMLVRHNGVKSSAAFIFSAVLVAACILGSLTSLPMVRNFQLKDGGKPNIVQSIDTIEDRYGTMKVAFDISCTPHQGSQGWALNAFSFWLQSRGLELTEHPEESKAPLLISCTDYKAKTGSDVEAISGANTFGYQLWALPGSSLYAHEKA